ncbi:hypothetical protein IWX81_000003 [Salinibacterium sp. CAN_S4]|uniref:hypothetical protein n=1 Tax=Salinibacterium sp. CAN_S4 TaxID=2787727 RepID=UPI0018EF98CA
MTDSGSNAPEPSAGANELDSNSLLSRLRVIEDQPLESRAAAFAQVHDQLQRRLEGGDSTASHG